jgi:sortase A
MSATPQTTQPRRARRATRAALRFCASVLITSGILLLADAGLTLAWQEPISAFIAQQNQDSLHHELNGYAAVLRREEAAVAAISDMRLRLSRLATVERRRARTGHAIGRIELPTLHRSYYVVQGTDEGSLEKGPGHYPSTQFPGEGGTVAIAGHRTTFLAPFRTINQLKPGDPIVLKMPYGRFTYRVERTQVVAPDAFWITRKVPGEERLVLSACHPLYSASHRIVAFAKLVNESP